MSCENEIGEIMMPDGGAVSYDALPNTGFRVLFPKAPMVNMFLQEITVPSIGVSEVRQNTPYVDINNVGEKIQYGDCICTFLIDKNLKNYREIFNWMRRMTVAGTTVGESDNPLIIINGKETIRLVEAWPMELSSLNFVTNATDVVYMTATVTFNLDYWEFVDDPFHKET